MTNIVIAAFEKQLSKSVCIVSELARAWVCDGKLVALGSKVQGLNEIAVLIGNESLAIISETLWETYASKEEGEVRPYLLYPKLDLTELV